MLTVWHQLLDKLETTDLRLDVHDSDCGNKAAKDASSRQARAIRTTSSAEQATKGTDVQHSD